MKQDEMGKSFRRGNDFLVKSQGTETVHIQQLGYLLWIISLARLLQKNKGGASRGTHLWSNSCPTVICKTPTDFSRGSAEELWRNTLNKCCLAALLHWPDGGIFSCFYITIWLLSGENRLFPFPPCPPTFPYDTFSWFFSQVIILLQKLLHFKRCWRMRDLALILWPHHNTIILSTP